MQRGADRRRSLDRRRCRARRVGDTWRQDDRAVLSLGPVLQRQIYAIRRRGKGLNYGYDKVVSPVAVGEMPFAFVVPQAGRQIEAGTRRDGANARLGRIQRLAGVSVRENLPRSAIGKVLKTELAPDPAMRGVP